MGKNKQTKRMTGAGTRKPKPNSAKEEKKVETKVDVFHGEDGRLEANGLKVDLCDCLNHACAGCFWPCASCGGRKCSPIECQKQRGFILTSTAQTGAGLKDHHVVKNPYVPDSFFAELKKREDMKSGVKEEIDEDELVDEFGGIHVVDHTASSSMKKKSRKVEE